ncbi:uracil-DNA glycosylase [Pelagibacterales bacterium SAG-MED15]|nr:uracil-DNA glycosylase [Pelagibacterales bacterium SAG-MED15]
MVNKEFLNEEFLKSIDSIYEFSNNPISRLKISLEPNEIKSKLENLKINISQIESCNLKNNAKKLVFNDGDFNSKLMIIGEGPDQKDDEVGKPFAGDAGSLLNKMFEAINIKRENIYITNVINYRPPDDRKPTISEINRYSKFLYEHISIIDPKIIVIMGSTAMETLVGSNYKISKERGKWKDIIIKGKTYLSIITFHPSYLLRQPDQKKYSWNDLKEIKKKLDELNISF